jgi:hypothetical protein
MAEPVQDFTHLNSVSTSADIVDDFEYSSNKNIEAGIVVSSMNSTYTFASMAMTHMFSKEFGLGLRAMMPLQFSKEEQLYLGQALIRFGLIEAGPSSMYFEGALTQAFYSAPGASDSFNMVGLSAGYLRRLKNGFSAGGLLGVDWSQARMKGDAITPNSSILYNKFAFVGTYNF